MKVMAATAAVLLLIAGCGDTSKAGRDRDDVRAVASFYPLAEAAERVGGDRAHVTNLTPPGVEPHDLELTSRQVDAVEDADVVLFLGGGFQPGLEELARRSNGTLVDLLEGQEVAAPSDPDEELDFDPHIWLDPTRMAGLVRVIRKTFVDVDPRGEAMYAANAEDYLAELAALDEELETGLASCDGDTIITAHAAFGYLARRYGLKQEAIAGLSPEAEPSADRLAELADKVRAAGVTTIFYETLVAPDIAEALAREAGITAAVLNPLEGLTEDEIEGGATYTTVMRDNLAALRSALGCR